jgi:hypothetical protein
MSYIEEVKVWRLVYHQMTWLSKYHLGQQIQFELIPFLQFSDPNINYTFKVLRNSKMGETETVNTWSYNVVF